MTDAGSPDPTDAPGVERGSEENPKPQEAKGDPEPASEADAGDDAGE